MTAPLLGLAPSFFVGSRQESVQQSAHRNESQPPNDSPQGPLNRSASISPPGPCKKIGLEKLCDLALESVDRNETSLQSVYEILNSFTAYKIFIWSNSFADRRKVAEACLELMIEVGEIHFDSKGQLWVPKGLAGIFRDEDIQFLMHRFPGYLPHNLDILTGTSPKIRKKIARKYLQRRMQKLISPQHPKGEQLIQAFLKRLEAHWSREQLATFACYHQDALLQDFRALAKRPSQRQSVEAHWTAEAQQWFLRQEMTSEPQASQSQVPKQAQSFREYPQMGEAIRNQALWMKTQRQVAVAQRKLAKGCSKPIGENNLNWVYGLFGDKGQGEPCIAFKAWTPVITKHEMKLCLRDFCLMTWDAMMDQEAPEDLKASLQQCLDQVCKKFYVPQNQFYLLVAMIDSLAELAQHHSVPASPSNKGFRDVSDKLIARFAEGVWKVQTDPKIRKSEALAKVSDHRATLRMQRCEKLVTDICELCAIPGRPAASPMKVRIKGPLGNPRLVNGTAVSFVPGAMCLEDINFMPRNLRDKTLEGLGTQNVQLLILLHLLMAYQDGHGKNLLITPQGIAQIDVDAILNTRKDKPNLQGRAPLRSALLGLPQAKKPFEASVLDQVDENWDWEGILRLCSQALGKNGKAAVRTLEERIEIMRGLLLRARKEHMTPLHMAFLLFPSYFNGWWQTLEKGYPDAFSAAWVGRYRLSRLQDLEPYPQNLHAVLEEKGYPPAVIITLAANHSQQPFPLTHLPDYDWGLHKHWVLHGKSHHQAALLVMAEVNSAVPIPADILSILDQVPMWVDAET